MMQTAFITGADRGLGFALSAGLLGQGWRVLAGQYLPEWRDLTRLKEQYPDRLFPLSLNVTDAASVQKAAGAAGQITNQVSPTNLHSISDGLDYAEMQRVYDVNALGPLRVVESFLPLMAGSSLKRLCFVSSEAGSIERCTRTAWYGYCMSKAALNMAVKILYNHLRPEGFTFRLYHPGWMRSYMMGVKNMEAQFEPEEAAANALPFFLTPMADEEQLALVDYEGNEWPW